MTYKQATDASRVRVLSCHTDRTKRIATEVSPHLFLTVSEDGTVRQHDLRRPHQCRSECPDPLFRAPPGVDLYSLSVSAVAPHTFAVAGQTDCAYICDRRMPEHQTPSWGTHTKRAGQVWAVRRLGLPDDEWSTREKRYRERHITCVKMNPHRADEVSQALLRAADRCRLFAHLPITRHHCSLCTTLRLSRELRRALHQESYLPMLRKQRGTRGVQPVHHPQPRSRHHQQPQEKHVPNDRVRQCVKAQAHQPPRRSASRDQGQMRDPLQT